MDRDLAGAVFGRWEKGLPVSEANLYKAAQVLGADADAVLTEARYYTALDSFLSKQAAAMSPVERYYFSLAAGEDPDRLEKVAGAYQLSADELLIKKLAQRDFKPDIEKIALMMPPEAIEEALLAQQAMMEGGGEGGEGAGGGGEEEAAAAALGPQGPQPGAQLQQDPTQRFKPEPTAPEQIAPGPEGNLQALLGEQQGVHGQAAQENGGLPPAGAQEPPPPPPTPEQRIQQVAPAMDPTTVSRYSEKLTEFEQQMGMSISDPKAMVKFVESMQKVDQKYIQEGIKQFAQQQEQEMGIGQQVAGQTPTVKGMGLNDAQPGAAGAGGPPPPGGAPTGPGAAGGAPEGAGGDPEAAAAEAAAAEEEAAAGGQGQPPKKKPPLPAAQAAGVKPKQPPAGFQAAEKVAQAARLLARAHLGA